jgi:hypothetical protein
MIAEVLVSGEIVVVGEDFVDQLMGSGQVFLPAGVGAGQRQKRFPQRPASGANPGVFVLVDFPAEYLSVFAGNQGPCENQVAGRVADPAGAEVDDGRELSLADEEVGAGEIAVEPDRVAVV